MSHKLFNNELDDLFFDINKDEDGLTTERLLQTVIRIYGNTVLKYIEEDKFTVYTILNNIPHTVTFYVSNPVYSEHLSLGRLIKSNVINNIRYNNNKYETICIIVTNVYSNEITSMYAYDPCTKYFISCYSLDMYNKFYKDISLYFNHLAKHPFKYDWIYEDEYINSSSFTADMRVRPLVFNKLIAELFTIYGCGYSEITQLKFIDLVYRYGIFFTRENDDTYSVYSDSKYPIVVTNNSIRINNNKYTVMSYDKVKDVIINRTLYQFINEIPNVYIVECCCDITHTKKYMVIDHNNSGNIINRYATDCNNFDELKSIIKNNLIDNKFNNTNTKNVTDVEDIVTTDDDSEETPDISQYNYTYLNNILERVAEDLINNFDIINDVPHKYKSTFSDIAVRYNVSSYDDFMTIYSICNYIAVAYDKYIFTVFTHQEILGRFYSTLKLYVRDIDKAKIDRYFIRIYAKFKNIYENK